MGHSLYVLHWISMLYVEVKFMFSIVCITR